MLKRLRFYIFYLGYCVAVCVAMALLLEAGLRLFTDRPQGLFDATPLNHTSLYHPSSRIPMDLMAVPYVIETNALGFRGPEIAREKPPGTTRIIALGDSITDGYMVDNPETYPVRLEGLLRDAGHAVEVVNAARGGSTIDREFWILRHHGAALSPDVVVLTFVANDIYEMGNRSVEALVNYTPEALAFLDNAALWGARSALGEWLLDRYFAFRLPGYRGEGSDAPRAADPDRYNIPGGTDYDAILPEALDKLRGLKIHLPDHDPAMEAQADVYLEVLEHLRDWCEARQIRLVWVWYPTFVQTYGATAAEPLYDYLLPEVAAMDIPLIDVTPSFRNADRATPLYLAPVDYHLTPEGNRRLAEAIATGLLRHGILAPADREVE